MRPSGPTAPTTTATAARTAIRWWAVVLLVAAAGCTARTGVQFGSYGVSWSGSLAGSGTPQATLAESASPMPPRPATIAEPDHERDASQTHVRLASANGAPELVWEPPKLAPLEAPAGLTLDDARCRAANRSLRASLLEYERALGRTLYPRRGRFGLPGRRDNPAWSLQEQLLLLQAARHSEDRAADAVELQIRMAEATALEPKLGESRALVASVRRSRERLVDSGLPVELTETELDRLALDLEAREAELNRGMEQASVNLASLVEDGPVAGTLLFPDVPLYGEAVECPGDPVRVALQNRAELRVLRLVLSRLSPETLPVARAVLSQYDAALGSVVPAGPLLTCMNCTGVTRHYTPGAIRQELCTRRAQLQIALAGRKRMIVAEVETARSRWQQRAEEWRIADRRVRTWQDEIELYGRQLAYDDVKSAAGLDRLRLKRVEAEVARARAFAAYKLAQVELVHAQGVLASGCGVYAASACECPECLTALRLLCDAAPTLPPGPVDALVPPAPAASPLTTPTPVLPAPDETPEPLFAPTRPVVE